MSATMYNTGLEDLEKIIAQETSGIAGAVPEQEDRDLAKLFIKIINHDARYAISRTEFDKRIMKVLEEI